MSPAWWEMFVIFGSIVAAMAVVLCTFAACMLGLAQLRSTGWGSAASFGLLLLCTATGTWWAWQIRAAFADGGTGFIAFMLGFMLIGPLAFAAIAWLMPTRRRQGGPRRAGRGLAAGFFAAALLCALALVVVMALPAYSDGVVRGSDLKTLAAPLLALTAGLTLAGLRVRRQRRALSATVVLAGDARPPVLYLREFRHERQPFVAGGAEELRPYLQSAVRWLPSWLQPSWADIQTVSAEEYLAVAMGVQLGPFVALGSPLDELPPLGAARDYAQDAGWQQRLVGLAHAACAIVLVPGTSDALGWEPRTLREAGLSSKLFVLVGSDAFQNSGLWWVGRLYGWRNPDWPAFRGLLQAAGYSTPPSAPRPRSVLGFDEAGRGRWLADGTALSPESYAGAIAAHLQATPLTGPLCTDDSVHPPALARSPTTAEEMDDIVSGRSMGFELRILGAILLLSLPVTFCVSESLAGAWMKPFGFQAGVLELSAISAVAGCLSLLLLAPRGMRCAAVLTGALAGAGAYATAFVLGSLLASSFGMRLRYELMFVLVVLGAAPGVAAMAWWAIRLMEAEDASSSKQPD